MLGVMLVVHVHIRVKPECVPDFEAATRLNAEASLEEPGIWCFDLARRRDDPTRFVLVEGYRSPEAPAAHKATPHYAAWRDAVAPMMAEPRSSIQYDALRPSDDGR